MKGYKKELSIVIVNYNTAQITVECIKSILKFAPKFSFEIIVVDNASSDQSIISLSRLKNITLLKNDTNLGFSKANNIGIKQAKGKYIMLLNSDTVIINNVFEELVSFAENHPEAGVIAPKLLNKDRSLQPSIFNFPTVFRAISQYWLNASKVLDKYGIETHDPVSVDAVVGAAFLITPKALKKVGLLNEKYFMYFEDLDYCREVKKVGLKVYYLPCSYLVHLHGSSGNHEVSNLLIASSKQYFGFTLYYLYTFVLWTGQKFRKLF